MHWHRCCFFFFQAEDGIRDDLVTGVQTCALPICAGLVNDPAPFNPKVVKYEIFGTGGLATINYLDLDAQPQKAENVGLPWSLTLTTTAPAASPNIIAQRDGDTITCRITVDAVVKHERP